MILSQFTEKSGYEIINMADPDIEISGVYCGDLLSWVIGRAEEGNLWLTIMSNMNVAAVSVMTDLACIVLCEGVKPDEALLNKCKQENINIIMSTKPVYATAIEVERILKG